MTLKELKSIIASGEGETLEEKETTGQRVDACETLCAFLNKDRRHCCLWRWQERQCRWATCFRQNEARTI